MRSGILTVLCSLALLAGCGPITLPPAGDGTGLSESSEFWRTQQYIPLDEGIALAGERTGASRYFATWNPVTRNLHANVAGARERDWHLVGMGTAWLCHAFPVGWCFSAQYQTGSGYRTLHYLVLQRRYGFNVEIR
jgi:hypothetical protein